MRKNKVIISLIMALVLILLNGGITVFAEITQIIPYVYQYPVDPGSLYGVVNYGANIYGTREALEEASVSVAVYDNEKLLYNEIIEKGTLQINQYSADEYGYYYGRLMDLDFGDNYRLEITSSTGYKSVNEFDVRPVSHIPENMSIYLESDVGGSFYTLTLSEIEGAEYYRVYYADSPGFRYTDFYSNCRGSMTVIDPAYIDSIIGKGKTTVYIYAVAYNGYKRIGRTEEVLLDISNYTVKFEDPNLESAVREVVNKPSGPILNSDVDLVTHLDASGRGISSLKGIEGFSNLTQLNLENNNLSDLWPLNSMNRSSLLDLWYLDLSGNNFEHFDYLDAQNLRYLDLSNNKITNVDNVSFLTNLSYLNLTDNRIESIDALNELISLKELYLSGNNISDYSPVDGYYYDLEAKDFEVPFSIRFGDLNGDSSVDSTDIIWLKRYILKIISTFPYEKGELHADVNADGSIDSTDLMLFKRYVLKIITVFPAEIMIKDMPYKVFEFNYENHAWVDINRGWYIDKYGRIVDYTILDENQSYERFVGSVPVRELREKYLLLLKARDSSIGPLIHHAFDLGTSKYKGYVSDTTDIEREILLHQNGDFLRYNDSPYSMVLVEWMDSIY